jgi:LuxR family transcriptional regulator, maltose regulon positive regulatory protein
MSVANPLLLLTKLGVPPPHPSTVARPRLLTLPASQPAVRLLLVSAPAGFGKTTFLADLSRSLLAQGDTCVAWYSLDERDNDPLRFLSHLVASLAQAVGERADLRPAGQALRGGPTEDAEYPLTLLLNALAAVPANQILVLDDYHLISSPAIHSAVAFVLEHMPPQMSLAISSRSDPPLQLSRLRARGGLLELRAADLRFTREEAASFLKRAIERDLPPEEVVALHGYTEGWPAGLQLTTLALRQRAAGSDGAGLAQWLSRLAASRRNVFDYLADEVFEQQRPEVRAFLMETSVLDRLSPALCDEITGRHDAAELLDRLEREGLFLVPLDEERRWFRYHHAFREFLRERLARELPDRVDELLRDASRWHEWKGQTGESLHYAMAARDFDRAARLIEAAAEGMWLRNEADALLNWISALPGEVVSGRPRLALFSALSLLHKQRPNEADAYLDRAERALEDGRAASTTVGEWGPGQGNRERTKEELGMLAALRAISAVIQGMASEGEEAAGQALNLLPEGKLSWRAIALVGLGVARGLAGDPAGAERALAEAKAVSRSAGSASMSFIAEHNLAVLQLLSGRLHEGAQTCRDLLRLTEEQEARHLHHVGETQVELGMVLCEWNDLYGALQQGQEALELARQTRQESTVATALQLLARVKQAQGDATGALEAVEQAIRLADEDSISAVAASAAAQRAQILLLQGELDAAGAWARSVEEGSGGHVEVDPPVHQFPTEAGSLARVWTARGRHDEAEALIQQMLAAAEARSWTGRVIESLVLLALYRQARGDADAALSALARALELAEPERFARAFLDEGEPVLALLRAAASGRSGSTYARHLLALAAGRPVPGREEVPFQPLAEPLSARELEVLRLVAGGATNQEIADALVITVGTVKIHLNHILSKLGVRNRTEAAARARELSLL